MKRIPGSSNRARAVQRLIRDHPQATYGDYLERCRVGKNPVSKAFFYLVRRAYYRKYQIDKNNGSRFFLNILVK